MNVLLATVATHSSKGGRTSNQCYERLTGSRVRLQVAGMYYSRDSECWSKRSEVQSKVQW